VVTKLTRLTHKIVIQLHLVAESCTICSSHCRWPVRKLSDTPSYVSCHCFMYLEYLWQQHRKLFGMFGWVPL